MIPSRAQILVVLNRLADAAEVFSADQSRATDYRVGLVQPVNVAECEELNEALRAARHVLWKIGQDCSPGEGRPDTEN